MRWLPHLITLLLALSSALALNITATIGDVDYAVMVDSVVQSPFDAPTFDSLFLTKSLSNLTFTWVDTTSVPYSLEVIISDAFESGMAEEPTGQTPTVAQPFHLDLVCKAQAQAIVVLKLTLPTETHLMFFSKECRVPGCSDGCLQAEVEGRGTCDYVAGECICAPDWFGVTDCSYFLQFSGSETSFCPNDTPTIRFAVPPGTSTTTDWIGFYPVSDAIEYSATLEFFYTSSRGKAESQPSYDNSSFPFPAFHAPGDYVVILFLNDLYEPVADIYITLKSWDECIDTATFHCDTDCKRGTCATANATHCECETGFEWYDCSLGCAGVVKVSDTEGNFTEHGLVATDRSYSINYEPCGWHFTPIEGRTAVIMQFSYFESSAYEQLIIYSGSRPNPDNLIVAFSGSQTLPPPIMCNGTEFYIYWVQTVGGYRGWHLTYKSYFPPPVVTNEQKFWDLATQPAPQGIVAAGVLLLAFAFFLLGFLFYHRHHWIVRASSLLFLTIIVVGAALGFASLFVFVGMPTEASCRLRVWLPSLAFVITFGALFLKNYRIARIFGNRKLKPVLITDLHLLRFIGLVVLYEVVFLLIWTFVDPVKVELKTDKLELGTDYFICNYSTPIFPILSLFSKVGLLVWGAYLSIKTRKVVQFFSESKFIGIAIYNTCAVSLIFVPLLYVLFDFQGIWLVLACVGILVIFLVTLVAIFARILHYIRKFGEAVPESLTGSASALKGRPSSNSHGGSKSTSTSV